MERLHIFERLDGGNVRRLCIPLGETLEDAQLNGEFLLQVLNEYANREITPEELEAAHAESHP